MFREKIVDLLFGRLDKTLIQGDPQEGRGDALRGRTQHVQIIPAVAGPSGVLTQVEFAAGIVFLKDKSTVSDDEDAVDPMFAGPIQPVHQSDEIFRIHSDAIERSDIPAVVRFYRNTNLAAFSVYVPGHIVAG